MKLCVPIPCFFGGIPFEAAVEKVAALGYKYVEIYDWQRLDFASARTALEKTGVTLLSMCTSEFNLTDPARRALWLEGLQKKLRSGGSSGREKADHAGGARYRRRERPAA